GGGFLIRGPFAVRPAVMSVRLREPFPGLYIPVDAELLPALHPDEARGLLRGRGLILLPEPADRPAVRAVSFDPARPVPPGAILDV
ncbi:hypothetical protein ACTUM1_15600, partial [Listeria monocytogenes]|uniref:hypothetical protein n=1 Tax=Listeria monocytogenes TaxID=1639 RepID=UPI003FA43263